MNDIKKFNLKVNEKKINKFLIIHFNFILEIPLKINDIKKSMHFNFIREIPLKLNRPKKSKMENFSQKGLCSRHVN